MLETHGRYAKYLRLAHESVFSIYFALLLVSLNEFAQGFSWASPGKLRQLYLSYRHPQAVRGIDDAAGERYAAFILVWFLACIIFFLLRLFARFRSTRAVVRAFAGIVVVAGFPALCVYSGALRLFFLQMEILAAAICVLLYLYRFRRTSVWLGLALSTIHFGTWTVFGSSNFLFGFVVLWPGWDWIWYTWSLSPFFAFSALGFCSAVLWSLETTAQTIALATLPHEGTGA